MEGKGKYGMMVWGAAEVFPDVFQPGFPAFLREKASEMYPRRFSGVVATPPPATSPTIAKTVEMP